MLHSNLSTIGLNLAIEGSNWWSSCGDHMHACSGSWLPEEKKYCCCDAGYMWTSSRICSETLVFGGPTSAPDGFGTKRSGSHLHGVLLCSTLDDDLHLRIEEAGQVRDMDADAAEHWVAKVLKEEGFDTVVQMNVSGRLRARHVDGPQLVRLNLYSLMVVYGVTEGPAEALAHRLEALDRFGRRLSTGTQGCDEASSGSGSGGGTGARGCEEEQSSHGSSGAQGCEEPQKTSRLKSGTQGCSKSSTGTRGCDEHHHTGAQGCHGKSGAQGCHHRAARGCDVAVVGCHSGVCGCTDSSVGDVFGIMLLMPLLLSFVAIAIPMAILAAPVMVLYSLALPIVLILTAYVTGSFLALLCSGITAAAWAGLVASYRSPASPDTENTELLHLEEED